MDRQKRIHSGKELLTNVRRARKLAERWGLDDAHPAEYIEAIREQPPDFDDLLGQIK